MVLSRALVTLGSTARSAARGRFLRTLGAACEKPEFASRLQPRFVYGPVPYVEDNSHRPGAAGKQRNRTWGGCKALSTSQADCGRRPHPFFLATGALPLSNQPPGKSGEEGDADADEAEGRGENDGGTGELAFIAGLSDDERLVFEGGVNRALAGSGSSDAFQSARQYRAAAPGHSLARESLTISQMNPAETPWLFAPGQDASFLGSRLGVADGSVGTSGVDLSSVGKAPWRVLLEDLDAPCVVAGVDKISECIESALVRFAMATDVTGRDVNQATWICCTKRCFALLSTSPDWRDQRFYLFALRCNSRVNDAIGFIEKAPGYLKGRVTGFGGSTVVYAHDPGLNAANVGCPRPTARRRGLAAERGAGHDISIAMKDLTQLTTELLAQLVGTASSADGAAVTGPNGPLFGVAARSLLSLPPHDVYGSSVAGHSMLDESGARQRQHRRGAAFTVAWVLLVLPT